MRRCALVAACVLLGACAAPPMVPLPEPNFQDARFGPPHEAVGDSQIFALSDAMRHYLRVDIARQLRDQGLVPGLIHALNSHGQLKLDYDSERTRNAAEAFDARKGNCLSLVIMTAALAKELKLQVTYQSVENDPTWSRRGGVAYQNGHVNLTLARRGVDSFRGYDSTSMLTVDFLPAEDILGQRARPISEERIVAMYMNNRAAEALDAGRLDDAYWWARDAIVHAPDYAAAYNTLGVVYLHHGDLDAAARSFANLLDRDPEDTQALSNLMVVRERQGNGAEVNSLRARLARLEPYPPYHFFFLGTAAMMRGDYRAARQLFAREVDRAAYSGEFHFWLGLAEYKLGDLPAAQRQLTLALENSTTESEHSLYAGKLERLRSYGVR